MPNRITELVTRLIAKDDASKIIEHVADDLDKLEKRPDVEVGIGVEDRTGDDLRKIDERLDGLSAADKQIVVKAQLSAAQKEVDRLARSLKDVDKLDDEEVKVRVDALGNARAELDRIEKQAEALDKEDVDITVDVDNRASGKFSQLKSDLSGAQGAVGKLNVLGKTAFSTLSTYAAEAGVAAGAAVALFVKNAVSDFQELALEVGKASDALGIDPETVSRLKEVSEDMGIDFGALQSAIGKMNRTAATTPGSFEGIGAAIKKSDDGALDVTQTFLSVVDAIDAIPDAGARAAAGQKIFGKGWTQIAELIAKGSDSIVESMDQVGEGKLVSDEQVRNARELRDSVDGLKDRFEEFSNTIGSEIAPALSQLADGLGTVLDAAGATFEVLQGDFDIPVLSQATRYLNPVTGGFNMVHDSIAKVNDEWNDFRGNVDGTVGAIATLSDGLTDTERAAAQAQAVLDRQAAATHAMYESATEGAERLDLLKTAQDDAREAAEEHITALEEEAALAEEMAGGFQSLADVNRDLADAQREQNRLAKDADATAQDRVDNALRIAELQVDQFEAMKQAAGATATATEKLDAQNKALLAQAETLKGPARTELLNYIATLNGIPPKRLSEIEALIDEGKLEEAERKIKRVSQNRKATVVYDADTTEADAARDRLDDDINAVVNIGMGQFRLPNGVIVREQGGYVPQTSLSLVGEKGPEMVALPGGSRVYSAAQTRQMLSARSTAAPAVAQKIEYHVHSSVNAAVVGSYFDVMNAVADANRRGARLLPRNP